MNLLKKYIKLSQIRLVSGYYYQINQSFFRFIQIAVLVKKKEIKKLICIYILYVIFLFLLFYLLSIISDFLRCIIAIQYLNQRIIIKSNKFINSKLQRMKYFNMIRITLLLLYIMTIQQVHSQGQENQHQLTTGVFQSDFKDVVESKSGEISQDIVEVQAQLPPTNNRKELLKLAFIENIKQQNLNISEEELNKKVEQYLKDHEDELLKQVQNDLNSNNSQGLSEEEKDKILKSTIAGVAAGAVPILVNAISASVISAVGFTAGGVAAGSIAAGVQAGLGGLIVQGSTFALLQSAGATGAGIFGATLGLPLVIAGLVIGAGVGAYFYFS